MTPRQQSILVGAVVTGILSTSYLGLLNTICCLGVIVGGIVTTQQYAAYSPGAIASGDGAVLGASAGAVGAVLSALFDVGLRPLGLDSQSVQQTVQEQLMQNMGGQGMSPEMMQQMQGDAPGLLSAMGIALLLLNVVVFAIFGAIGGALGTTLFGGEDAGGAAPGQVVEAEAMDE
ncbi:hypothetical protein [Salinibacter altiplanensis]|uniref:hypothetical protein n=1 Tax=Salinibacter altiplanensis TaxID=1803181 RepID=UPI000C9F1A6D|nr:hypothetical protein [Salinibacter altiplanensis]